MSASDVGLVGCRHCARVWPLGTARCGLCGSRLSDGRYGVQAVWAWWWAGLIVYIPANLFPMLITTELGSVYATTIIGGVLDSIALGELFVAAVIFFASVVIPVAKFIVIALIALRLGRLGPRDREVADDLLGVVELIGRWSMIDVFVVAILSALVQLGAAATIEPGFATICFALAVVFTMLAAQAIDPRLIFRDDEADRGAGVGSTSVRTVAPAADRPAGSGAA